MRTTTSPRPIPQMLAAFFTVVAVLLIGTPTAGAHPLGDFTTNTATRVVIGPTSATVAYAADLAEIPTLQSDADTDGNGQIGGEELAALAQGFCEQPSALVDLRHAGQPLQLAVVDATATAAPGSGGLPTVRIDCRLEAALPAMVAGSADRFELDITDTLGASRLGWHEVVVQGDRMTVADEGTALTESPTDHLADYPDGEPLDVTSARIVVDPGGSPYVESSSPGAQSIVPGVDRLADGLMDREVSGWSAILLLATAALLGAMHAFAPGHGKTVMAAYLLGEQGGSVRHALALGATVTATHTVGVLTLGAMISLTTLTSPDSIYPWLGILSGLLVAGIGANLLRLAIRNRSTGGLIHLGHHHGDPADSHSHDHDHDHQHALVGHGHVGHGHVGHGHADHGHADHGHHHLHPHDHAHGPAHDPHSHGAPHAATGSPRMRLGSVVAMGFAGGMVPSPSALVVLLGAAALGRTVFGIGMVAAYGAGMALTLVGAGLTFVLLRDRSARLLSADPTNRLRTALRYGPLLTAVAVVGGGLTIAGRAVTQL